MSGDLTPRKKEIYDWIVSFAVANQCPPTIREIGKHFGISSPNGVISNLIALEKKGMIRRKDGARSRGIEIVEVERQRKLKDAVVEAAVAWVNFDGDDDYALDVLKKAVKEYRGTK